MRALLVSVAIQLSPTGSYAFGESSLGEVAEMLRTTRFAASCEIDVSSDRQSNSVTVKIADNRGIQVELLVSESSVSRELSESLDKLVVSNGKIGLASYWSAAGLVQSPTGEKFQLNWLVNDQSLESEVFKLAGRSEGVGVVNIDCGF
jgi:hypothetical protein